MASSDSCLVISDTHFHNHPQFGGQRVPEGTSIYDEASGDSRYPGCNQRAIRLFNATERAFRYAKKNGIDTVFHLGDMFHTKANVPLAVLNGAVKVFTAASASGVHVYSIPGNHDYAGKSPRWTSLHTLFPIFPVCTSQAPDVRLITVGKFVLAAVMVPYMSSKASLLEALHPLCGRVEDYLRSGEATHSALFMHVSVDGAKTGPHEYVMREGLTLKEIPFEYFHAVISGHYHMYQRIPKGKYEFVYVGGIAQHNFGEGHYTPGYLRLDLTETAIKVVHIENRHSPRFHSVTCNTREELLQLKVDVEASLAANTPDYVHIDWRGGVYPKDVELPEEWVIVDKAHTSALVKPRIEISVSKDTPESLVEKYVGMAADPEDKKALIELGRQIIAGAGE